MKIIYPRVVDGAIKEDVVSNLEFELLNFEKEVLCFKEKAEKF
jgi:hypothetical protein